MLNPDTISVTVSRSEELEAEKADIHVTIRGASLVTGSAAIKHAREVALMATALAEIGVNEQQIRLKGIHAESSGGLLGRSTSASYHVRVRCEDLGKLADVLAVITAQRHATLDYLSWHYPEEKIKPEWLRTCLAEAVKKGNAVASGLGVKLLGVHDFQERWTDSEQPNQPRLTEVSGMIPALAAVRSARVEVGVPLSNTKSVELQLTVKFRVTELGSKAP
jgi:uncharacterized protein YggE